VSNVIYLPRAKENLSQQEVEQAMQLIYQAWSLQQSVKIPPSLLCLTDEQWEMLEEALDSLLLEQENSVVH
jgi:uncharacterized protein YrzB (UPF0473 family)